MQICTYRQTDRYVHLNFISEGGMELKEAEQLKQFKKVMGKVATT